MLADKAYSARAHRAALRERGITAVIPEPADPAAHRRGRGSRGGRPVGYDRIAYPGRNVVERAFYSSKPGEGSRPDTRSRHRFRGVVVLAAITPHLGAQVSTDGEEEWVACP